MAKQLKVTSPYSDETLGTLDTHDEAAIEAALSKAYVLYRDKSKWQPVHERVAMLDRLAQVLSKQASELALQAAKEGGKPLKDSQVEVDRAIDGVKLAIETLRTEAGTVVPMQGTAAGAGRMAFTQKEPIGVVVAVSAFNHPFNLIVHQVAAAIAAGCPVIVKPAQNTPLSCQAFVKAAHEAGLDPDWCQMVNPESRELSEKLVTDSRVAFFSFIGSAEVGWSLRSKLSPGTRCALEHGGVAPLILCEDADMDSALAAITKGGFYHAGQVCVSVQRVFAHASIAKEFAERLAEKAKQLVVGDPASEETEVGPLIRPGEVDRIHQWVEEAVEGGAELLCGGDPLDNHCYAPTVLFEPPTDSKVATKEIFGPVVAIFSYDALDLAIEQANSLPFSFQAAVMTKDIDKAMKVFREIDASAVMLNDHTAFRVDGMPFAGLKHSGLGVGGIPHTMADMQVEKMLVINA